MKTIIKYISKLVKKWWFWYVLILPAILVCAFFYLLYLAVDWKEHRDRQIFMDGYEAGHFEGLNESAENTYEDFYSKLSPNPQVAYLFKKYFPKEEEAKVMRAISLAESRGKQLAINKKNRNGSVDSGFFQINTIHKDKGESVADFIKRMHNIEENFKMARKVLDKQGLSAWSVYNNGNYLAYIK